MFIRTLRITQQICTLASTITNTHDANRLQPSEIGVIPCQLYMSARITCLHSLHICTAITCVWIYICTHIYIYVYIYIYIYVYIYILRGPVLWISYTYPYTMIIHRHVTYFICTSVFICMSHILCILTYIIYILCYFYQIGNNMGNIMFTVLPARAIICMKPISCVLWHAYVYMIFVTQNISKRLYVIFTTYVDVKYIIYSW